MVNNKKEDVKLDVEAPVEPQAVEPDASVQKEPEFEVEKEVLVNDQNADEPTAVDAKQAEPAAEESGDKELDEAYKEYMSYFSAGSTEKEPEKQTQATDANDFDDLDDPSQKKIKELEKHIAALRAKTEEFDKVAKQAEAERRESAFMNSLYKTYPDLTNNKSELFKEFQEVFKRFAGNDPAYRLNPRDTLIMVKTAKHNVDRIKAIASETARRTGIANSTTLSSSNTRKSTSLASAGSASKKKDDYIDPKYVEMAKSGRFVR